MNALSEIRALPEFVVKVNGMDSKDHLFKHLMEKTPFGMAALARPQCFTAFSAFVLCEKMNASLYKIQLLISSLPHLFSEQSFLFCHYKKMVEQIESLKNGILVPFPKALEEHLDDIFQAVKCSNLREIDTQICSLLYKMNVAQYTPETVVLKKILCEMCQTVKQSGFSRVKALAQIEAVSGLLQSIKKEWLETDGRLLDKETMVPLYEYLDVLFEKLNIIVAKYVSSAHKKRELHESINDLKSEISAFAQPHLLTADGGSFWINCGEIDLTERFDSVFNDLEKLVNLLEKSLIRVKVNSDNRADVTNKLFNFLICKRFASESLNIRGLLDVSGVPVRPKCAFAWLDPACHPEQKDIADFLLAYRERQMGIKKIDSSSKK